MIETLSSNARERVTEGETSFRAFGRGNTLAGLPEFAIVYGRFVGVSTGPADAEGPTSSVVEKAGNRVVDVCDLLA